MAYDFLINAIKNEIQDKGNANHDPTKLHICPLIVGWLNFVAHWELPNQMIYGHTFLTRLGFDL